jgi:hypothetical protein
VRADTPPPAVPALWPAPVDRLDLARLPRPYAFVVRPATGDRPNGVDVVTLDAATLKPLTRSPTSLACARVHAAASTGQLACYAAAAATGMPLAATVLSVHDATLARQSNRPSGTHGLPSRTRMSADGRLAATTEFIAGHSYVGTAGNLFSTATSIWRNDVQAPPIALQDWPVVQDGHPVRFADLNLWGVTFDPHDANHFFLTVAWTGKPHLAEGHVKDHRLVVVRDGVECPSFSPDGRRLAFKKRTSATTWSPAVLDLATMKEHVFDVGHSVDDQIEWLDAHRLVYEVVKTPMFGAPSVGLVMLDADAAHPTESAWLADARSPAIVRRP